jgi:hypothetical protein
MKFVFKYTEYGPYIPFEVSDEIGEAIEAQRKKDRERKD